MDPMERKNLADRLTELAGDVTTLVSEFDDAMASNKELYGLYGTKALLTDQVASLNFRLVTANKTLQERDAQIARLEDEAADRFDAYHSLQAQHDNLINKSDEQARQLAAACKRIDELLDELQNAEMEKPNPTSKQCAAIAKAFGLPTEVEPEVEMDFSGLDQNAGARKVTAAEVATAEGMPDEHHASDSARLADAKATIDRLIKTQDSMTSAIARLRHDLRVAEETITILRDNLHQAHNVIGSARDILHGPQD